MNGTNNQQEVKYTSVPVGPSPLPDEKEKRLVGLVKPVLAKLKDIWLKIPEKLRKVLSIVGIVFTAILFLMIVLSLLFNIKKSQPPKEKPTPAVSYEPVPSSDIITNPSRYATDSGVLTIEGNIRKIEKELDIMQVNEADLLPPRLDFDINFDK